MSAAIKMDELLVTWLGSDNVFENVLKLVETYRSSTHNTPSKSSGFASPPSSPTRKSAKSEDDLVSDAPPTTIPPFYRPAGTISNGVKAKPIRKRSFEVDQSWDGIFTNKDAGVEPLSVDNSNSSIPAQPQQTKAIKEQVADIFQESGKQLANGNSVFLSMDNFVKITKEICSFPTFFNGPLYKRILYLWNTHTLKSPGQRAIIWKEFQKDDLRVGVDPDAPLEEGEEKNELLEHLDTVITEDIFKWYWVEEMEDYDASERFFRLVKKPAENHIGKNDFLPYMKELLRDHPVSTILSFLRNSGFIK